MNATTEPSWLVTAEKANAVVQRLVQVARPKKIFLFGSYARGKVTADSDLDVLVVTGDEVEDTRKESVRLRSAMRGIEMPMDILVVRETRFEELRKVPSLIYEEASRTGKLVYESES